jgi:tetratricopeptide (TPR) repeat protein
MTALILLSKAEPLLNLERWSSAHDLLRRARQLPADSFLRAEILSRDGEALQGMSLFREALWCYSKAHNLYEKLGIPFEQISSLLGVSACLRIIGNYSRARRMWRSVERASFFGVKGPIHFGVELERALVARGEGDFAETRRRVEKVLKEGARGDLSDLQHAYWISGGLERFTGNFLKALVSYTKAVRLAVKIGNDSSRAFALCGMAGVQRVLGDDRASINNYRAAHHLLKKKRDPFGEAYGLCGTANAFRTFGDAKKTLPLYRRSSALYKRLGDESSEAFAYWGLGGSLRRLGQFGPSLSAYQRAQKLFKKSHDDRGRVMTHLGLARVAEDRGHLRLALREVGKAQGVARQSKLRYETALALFERGRLQTPDRPPFGVLKSLGIRVSALRRWRDIP